MVEPAQEGSLSGLRARIASPLAADPSVRFAWLHGSRARHTAREESDIDVDHRIACAAIHDDPGDLAELRDRGASKLDAKP